MVQKKRQLFCEHLADWMVRTDWHYTTLVGVMIDVVVALPDDADQLVHALLSAHPTKPDRGHLVDFLLRNTRLLAWFRQSPRPKLNRLLTVERQTPELIDKRLPVLTSASELAEYFDVSESQLEWFAGFRRFEPTVAPQLMHYHYTVRDKRHGEIRLIEMPKRRLKALQRRILDEILCAAPVHDCAHGFVLGRSCRTHARAHVAQHHVFLFDLSNWFAATQWPQVLRVFSQLGYPPAVASILTGMCTHKSHLDATIQERLTKAQSELLSQRHLPQGAPSSPCLANSAMHHLDKRLFGLAKSLDLRYTRYADDLAFSGSVRRDWSFLEPLIGAICLEQGLALNFRKTRRKQPHQKQRITGIVVNEKLNIDRAYFDRLKATLTNCVRHGLASQNRAKHDHFRAHLAGCIAHVSSLNPTKGAKLQRLYAQIADEI